MRRQYRVGSLLILAAVFAFGQTVSSSVSGVLVDPTGAAVPGASCKLADQATGAVQTIVSRGDGFFTFPRVLAATYTLTVQAPGFKLLEMKDLTVTSSEVRTLGNLTLQVGEVRESVVVQAEAAVLQLASGERAGTVTGSQVNDIALKGRDFFALLQTIPGVVDTSTSRETTSNTGNNGIYINGARDNQKNFSIDGMTSMDAHSNSGTSYMPNMDAIAEVRILTSNYQAEYGRNSGGTITAITRSGSQAFHGSGYDFYRHESLNANNFFNNRSGTPKPPYRYRISGYSLGGPIYVPGKFNSNKDKFFFFWSQEYTGVKKDYGAMFTNVPTALERDGDFSRSFDVNGSLISIKDPSNGQPFPGNMIPKSRFSARGLGILNFYPLPNFTDPDPRNLYRWNHRDVYSGGTPRRNDVLRTDANLTPSLRLYYRYGRDIDNTLQPWTGKAGNVNFFLTPMYVQRTGTGHLVHVTKTFSPILVYEGTFGASRIHRDFDYQDRSLVMRSKMGNIPQWYADPAMPDYIPTVNFGGQPANPVYFAVPEVVPNPYRNPVYSVMNDITRIYGAHSFKAGLYVEKMAAQDPVGGSYLGNFDFSRDTNNPFDSGHSYSNALLGNFRSYTETSKVLPNHLGYWHTEWYVQDNWRVAKRLTLDLGMRFYHMPPIAQLGTNDAATLIPALYDPRKAPSLYLPALDASGRRVARDPITGGLDIAPLIGQYVPGSGDPANGTVVGGLNGVPGSLYTRPFLSYGPRLGFAYDPLGDGKTALRGGWGWFHDTAQNNPFNATVGNPPVSYTPTLFFGNLETYAQGGGALGPSSMQLLFGRHKTPNTMNYSFGVQRQIWGTVIDVSYVGGLSRNLFLRREINPIPLYAHFDSKNFDPTQPGRPLPDNFLRPYAGYGSLRVYDNGGSSNYNSLQVAVNRRFTRGLQFGIAYTFAKTLDVADTDTTQVSPYFPERRRNYGPAGFDRSQTFIVNYMYELPKVGPSLSWKPAGWVLDHWVLSGITSFVSGAPFTPGFSTTDGADITGSSEGARVNLIASPALAKGDKTFLRNFNTDAFARPARGEFGNAGVNILRGPGINNWDLAVSKRVPLLSEARFIQFRTELFNTWNHTQFSDLFTTARFDTAGKQVDSNFGAYRAARAARIIQLSLKVVF